jgi:hypothetical protein
MLTLFVVSSLEGWPDIMYQAVDVTGVDKGPKLDNSPANAYYFVGFILIGTFFFLNFFIGVLFLKYNEAQKNETKGYTQEHLVWLDMQKMIIAARPDYETTNVPENKHRKKFHAFVGHNAFDIFIMSCIVLNMIQMACLFEGASAEYLAVLDYVNYIFTTVFACEALLKLIAYGKTYFYNAWNKFDFIVVISSLVDIAL